MYLLHVFYLTIFLLTGCSPVRAQLPADPAATTETVNLYRNMHALAQEGIMFGHQDDLAYGVEWKYKEGRSDVKDAAGDYPAVYGWELGGIERAGRSANIDGVPFGKMKKFIREGYERGAVITLSWHTDSPFGHAKGAWDTTHGTVASVLPGGANHTLYKEWLDRAATFIGDLKGKKGEAIPVLFRPFHEHTGNWFWWCRNASSAVEYVTLWRFTHHYLQNVKQLHNLIWVYNTSGNFSNEAEFLERYPGDDVVDVLSFDAYQYGDPMQDKSFELNTNAGLKIIGKLAKEKEKLFALAETGYEAIPYPKWWTGTLMSAIGENRISWVLVWRNHGYQAESKKMHYYAPYKGQVSQPDFMEFNALPNILLEEEVRKKNLYDSVL